MIQEPEKPIDPELMKAINSFTMPTASPGMQVLYYRNGVQDRTRVEIAYMLHANARTATIFALMSNRRMDAVRHVSDPKLKLSPDQRENGAWEYTEEYRERIAQRSELTARLQKIETLLEAKLAVLPDAPVPPPVARAKRKRNPEAARGSSNRLNEYRLLVERCKRAGVPGVYGMKKEQLTEALAKVEMPAAIG
jgi:hypothetical protein